MTRILLLIPAYNESKNLPRLIQKIEAYRATAALAPDYLVINDGSTDGEEALLLAQGVPHVELVQNLGIGGAMQTGYKYAQRQDYDIAVQFDGDGQHDLDSLPRLVAPLMAGTADMTVGSRFVAGAAGFKSSTARQTGIRLISAVIRLVTGKKIHDVTSGYRACNRAVIARFAASYPLKYPEPESYVGLLKNNFRIEEVGVRMYERTAGRSSIGLRGAVAYMIDVTLGILIASSQKKEK